MSGACWSGPLPSPAATGALGRVIAASAGAGDVVALAGELGAGKTELVRGMARGLGLDPRRISSPTFVVAREHEAPHLVLVHVDAYSITGPEALESIGFSADDPGELGEGALLAVEWADRIRPALGPHVLEVVLEHTGPESRHATLTAGGHWRARADTLRARIEQALADLPRSDPPPAP